MVSTKHPLRRKIKIKPSSCSKFVQERQERTIFAEFIENITVSVYCSDSKYIWNRFKLTEKYIHAKFGTNSPKIRRGKTRISRKRKSEQNSKCMLNSFLKDLANNSWSFRLVCWSSKNLSYQSIQKIFFLKIVRKLFRWFNFWKPELSFWIQWQSTDNDRRIWQKS